MKGLGPPTYRATMDPVGEEHEDCDRLRRSSLSMYSCQRNEQSHLVAARTVELSISLLGTGARGVREYFRVATIWGWG